MSRSEAVAKSSFRIFSAEGESLPDLTELFGVEPDFRTKLGERVVAGGAPATREVWLIEEVEKVSDE